MLKCSFVVIILRLWVEVKTQNIQKIKVYNIYIILQQLYIRVEANYYN